MSTGDVLCGMLWQACRKVYADPQLLCSQQQSTVSRTGHPMCTAHLFINTGSTLAGVMNTQLCLQQHLQSGRALLTTTCGNSCSTNH